MAIAAGISLIERAQAHADRAAIVAPDGTYRYADLLAASERVALALLDGRADLDGARVCYLVGPSFRHVALQWGIFRAGGMAVPLCASHPAPELAHVIDDSRPLWLVADAEFEARLAPLAQTRQLRCVAIDLLLEREPARGASLPHIAAERSAILIYTSGTTGKPKGALATHAILSAQMRSIVTAWELATSDRLLHVLPLHHLHGILNALSAPLYAGACVEFMPRFDARAVLDRFGAEPALSLFMAVPTIYSKLCSETEALEPAQLAAARAGMRRMRLAVSGSAALPVSLLARFRELSGHVLLERYGMTEIGMGLGNPLHGERRSGTVGIPFPGVEARIVDEGGRALGNDSPGELQIRGPNVFDGYWERPEATKLSFTSDGFFRTGDVAVRERGYYRLLGRESVDIIKTGGFKVSALEVEEALREHPAIAEVAVLGVPDVEWGERVAAAVVLAPAASLSLEELRVYAKQHIANYKVPSLLSCVETLPRNALGKVQKPALRALFPRP